jgi:hypothetical protein
MLKTVPISFQILKNLVRRQLLSIYIYFIDFLHSQMTVTSRHVTPILSYPILSFPSLIEFKMIQYQHQHQHHSQLDSVDSSRTVRTSACLFPPVALTVWPYQYLKVTPMVTAVKLLMAALSSIFNRCCISRECMPSICHMLRYILLLDLMLKAIV